MYGTALSRVAQLRRARSDVWGSEVTEKVVNVGQELTVRHHNKHTLPQRQKKVIELDSL